MHARAKRSRKRIEPTVVPRISNSLLWMYLTSHCALKFKEKLFVSTFCLRLWWIYYLEGFLLNFRMEQKRVTFLPIFPFVKDIRWWLSLFPPFSQWYHVNLTRQTNWLLLTKGQNQNWISFHIFTFSYFLVKHEIFHFWFENSETNIEIECTAVSAA